MADSRLSFTWFASRMACQAPCAHIKRATDGDGTDRSSWLLPWYLVDLVVVHLRQLFRLVGAKGREERGEVLYALVDERREEGRKVFVGRVALVLAVADGAQ